MTANRIGYPRDGIALLAEPQAEIGCKVRRRGSR
jgi:hypothetical protein